jgi:hypothetical protein
MICEIRVRLGKQRRLLWHWNFETRMSRVIIRVESELLSDTVLRRKLIAVSQAEATSTDVVTSDCAAMSVVQPSSGHGR